MEFKINLIDIIMILVMILIILISKEQILNKLEMIEVKMNQTNMLLSKTYPDIIIQKTKNHNR